MSLGNLRNWINEILSREQKNMIAPINLTVSLFDSVLGTMIIIADEEKLYLLEFVDRVGFENEMTRFIKNTKLVVKMGITKPINSIISELKAYFRGKLRNFKTPIILFGTDFQKLAWNYLLKTQYGQTISYLGQANSIGRPSSYRAVANANSLNQIVIVVPCHRVINNNGNLGGYSAGLARKKWLIEHEARYKLFE